MLKIRLKRVGRKHDPSFRVVVTESTRGPKSGNYIEMLGSYDPRKDSPQINADRVKHWISVGAQASGTVHNILVGQKIIEGKKVNVLPRKRPIPKAVVEKAESGTPVAAAAPVATLETTEEAPAPEAPAE